MALQYIQLVQLLVLLNRDVSSVHGWLFGSNTRTCAEVGETFTKDSPFDTLPLPECFKTDFYLYTSTVTAISDTNIPNAFSPSKRTIFFVHGYRDTYNNNPWLALVDALQTQGDYNIIITDWKEGSQKSFLTYANAAANARVAAVALHNLFSALQDRGLDSSNSLCIGHSLGAHVCGLAGQYKKFGRISGLDPAGPEFEKLSAGARLSRDDADFVDVLHTDGGGSYLVDYGTLIPMGHLDFYANGGKRQPGCNLNKRELQYDEFTDADKESVNKIRSLLANEHELSKRGDIGCSHGRALRIYIETVNSQKCVADKYYQSATYKDIFECTSSCSSATPVVGFHATRQSAPDGMYGFTTNAEPEFCD